MDRLAYLIVEIQIETPGVATVPAAAVPGPVVTVEEPALPCKIPPPLKPVIVTVESAITVAVIIKTAVIAVAIETPVVPITVPSAVSIAVPSPITVTIMVAVMIPVAVVITFKMPVMIAINRLGRGQRGAACNQRGSNRQYP